jgi:radical SAM-linked protein
MNLSIAQPLSVGMYSIGDYMDVVLTEELDENYIKDALNENMPSGIKAFEVVKIKDSNDGRKVPQSMALIDAAKYIIKIKYSETESLNEELKVIEEKNEWSIMKKSKSGEKLADIKPLVKNIDFQINNNLLVITAIISCGSKENLSAELLSRYIINNTSSVCSEAFVDIMREEMYVENKDGLIPIYKYLA